MTDVSFDHLIGQSELLAASDEEFVGSVAHLGLLQAYAEERAPSVRLHWAEHSYSELTEEGLLIRIKDPATYGIESRDDRVRLAAQYLVHEIHHVLNSDHAAFAEFEERKMRPARAQNAKEINPAWVMTLCNQLEDARLLEQARRQDPDDVSHLEAVHRTGFQRDVSKYQDAFGEAPWGPSPADAGEQLLLALYALILLNERFDVTHRNQAALEKMQSYVEVARSGTFSTVIRATEAIEAIIVKTLRRN